MPTRPRTLEVSGQTGSPRRAHDRENPRLSTKQDRKEEAALANTIDRLSRLFPELSEEEVRRAVNGKHTDFENAPIRDFVPVLVENVARDELENQARRHRA